MMRWSEVYCRMGAHGGYGKDPYAQDLEVEKIWLHQNYKNPLGSSHSVTLLKIEQTSPAESSCGGGLPAWGRIDTKLADGWREQEMLDDRPADERRVKLSLYIRFNFDFDIILHLLFALVSYFLLKVKRRVEAVNTFDRIRELIKPDNEYFTIPRWLF